MTSSARVQKPAWFFLLLIIIFFPSEIMECASLASPRQPLTQVQAQAHANMEKEVFEEEMKMRVGSRPPNCENKCGGCEPCMAIQVPTSVDRMRPLYANYEPEGWKCKCGSTFYNP